MRTPSGSQRPLSRQDKRVSNEQEQRLVDAVAGVWSRSRKVVLQRVQLLEAAARALERSAFPPGVRERAHGAAHKLAGALGCFGLHEGTAIARDLEQLLEPGTDLRSVEASTFSRKVADLRFEIEAGPARLNKDRNWAETT